jgi:hypothetical protein
MATDRPLALLLVLVAWPARASAQTSPSDDLAADEFEPNDSFTTATPLADGTTTGLSVETDDVDIYAVNATGDLDMALPDCDELVPLVVSEGTSDEESLSCLPTRNRTYYIAVYGCQSATGS